MKRLPIGISDYKIIISENYYFVDKTLFIQELLCNSSAVTLMCRPRRFGKTLNLSMLRYFFEKTEVSNAQLFVDKKIWQIEDARVQQGQYPVIFISFKDVKDLTFEDARSSMAAIISNEFKRHASVLIPRSEEYDKPYYDTIVNKTTDSVLLVESL